MKKLLFTLVTFILVTAVRGEVPVSATGVYRSWSGIESRRITLLPDGSYMAKWDGDIGSNGLSRDTWELVGTEVRLSPKKEEGMISGYFRVLLLRDFKGRQALLRKEDQEHSDNEFFHLFLQTKEPDKRTTDKAAGPSVSDCRL